MITVDSKVPALRFPEFKGEWKENLIEEFASVNTGNKDTQDREEGGAYPFFVRSDNVERINTYAYDGEAVLTSGDGVGVGKNFHYIIGKFNYHQRVYCIYNFDKTVSGRFFYYYFSTIFYNHVIRLSAKNSVDSVRRSMITDLAISLPCLPEQQKIASFLTAVDAKIELLTKKKTLLEQYKKGVVQQLFIQQIRFKDDNGNDFPEWEEREIGNFLVEYIEKVPANTEIPVLTSSRTGLHFQRDYFNDRELANEGEYKVVPKGYMTYRHMSDDSTFKFNINDLVDRGAVSKEYPVFTTLGLNMVFLHYILNCGKDFETFAVLQKQGGTRTRLYFKNLKKFRTSIPSLVEQTKIVSFLEGVNSKINSVNAQLELTKTYKKGLLQQLFL